MKRIMIDCETLSTEHNAVVLSIGAAVWEDGKIINKFYRELEVDTQKALGRHISSSTLTWWNAQKTPMPEGSADVKKALSNLMVLCSDCDEIWSRGYTDDMWIETLCKDFGILKGWKYWQWRDARTVDTFGIYRQDKPPVLHNALDDACQQAMDVQYVLDQVNELEQISEAYGFWKRLWLCFAGGK